MSYCSASLQIVVSRTIIVISLHQFPFKEHYISNTIYTIRTTRYVTTIIIIFRNSRHKIILHSTLASKSYHWYFTVAKNLAIFHSSIIKILTERRTFQPNVVFEKKHHRILKYSSIITYYYIRIAKLCTFLDLQRTFDII